MINNGASDAAKEVGAKLITVGPAFQGDLSSQLEVFENLTSQGVSAIAVAPSIHLVLHLPSRLRWMQGFLWWLLILVSLALRSPLLLRQTTKRSRKFKVKKQPS